MQASTKVSGNKKPRKNSFLNSFWKSGICCEPSDWPTELEPVHFSIHFNADSSSVLCLVLVRLLIQDGGWPGTLWTSVDMLKFWGNSCQQCRLHQSLILVRDYVLWDRFANWRMVCGSGEGLSDTYHQKFKDRDSLRRCSQKLGLTFWTSCGPSQSPWFVVLRMRLLRLCISLLNSFSSSLEFSLTTSVYNKFEDVLVSGTGHTSV